jgi:hypothetical protein
MEVKPVKDGGWARFLSRMGWDFWLASFFCQVLPILFPSSISIITADGCNQSLSFSAPNSQSAPLTVCPTHSLPHSQSAPRTTLIMSIKLTYFNIQGAAEKVRLALALKGLFLVIMLFQPIVGINDTERMSTYSVVISARAHAHP